MFPDSRYKVVVAVPSDLEPHFERVLKQDPEIADVLYQCEDPTFFETNLGPMMEAQGAYRRVFQLLRNKGNRNLARVSFYWVESSRQGTGLMPLANPFEIH